MRLTGRWAALVVAALVLSLAANLFVAGALVGRGFGRPEGAVESGVQRFVDTLPPAARAVVQDAFKARRPDLVASVGNLRAARRQVVELLRAPTIDLPALDTAMAELRDRTTRTQALVQEIVTAAAVQLPADARAEWHPPLR